MKKALLVLFALLCPLLTACTQQSAYADLPLLCGRINDVFGERVIDAAALSLAAEDGRAVAYWLPNEPDNVCVSFFLQPETGHIERCCVTFDAPKKQADLRFLNRLRQAYTQNNAYIRQSDYASPQFYTVTFADTRFTVPNTAPTLKKEINPDDLY